MFRAMHFQNPKQCLDPSENPLTKSSAYIDVRWLHCSGCSIDLPFHPSALCKVLCRLLAFCLPCTGDQAKATAALDPVKVETSGIHDAKATLGTSKSSPETMLLYRVHEAVISHVRSKSQPFCDSHVTGHILAPQTDFATNCMLRRLTLILLTEICAGWRGVVRTLLHRRPMLFMLHCLPIFDELRMQRQLG